MTSRGARPEVAPSGAEEPADEALARLASSGDPASFETLVGRYQERVYRLSRRLTRNNADAEEALQETFLSLLRRLRTFRSEAKFSTWLFRIATNSALMIRRRRSRQRAVSLDAYLPRFDRRGRHATPIEAAAPAASGESLDRLRLARRAAVALDRLPERYRTPFVLRDLEEVPTADVAKILDLTAAAVRQRVHRARLMLRGYLEAGARAKR